MKALMLVSSCLFLFACSEDNFKKYVALQELRIVALVGNNGSNKSEVGPGASLTITPWVSDVTETSGLQFSWQACVDPGLNNGAEPNCDNNSSATSVTTGSITTLNSGNTFTGAADSFVVNIPAQILTGRSAQQQYNGVNYLVLYSVTNSSGKTVKSFKRVVVSGAAKTNKNTNPQITQVNANGSAISSLNANQTYSLNAVLSGSSQENYQVLNGDGSYTNLVEEIQVTWFYSDGSTKYYRTINQETTDYTTPTSYPSTRNSFVIAVARDPRGGLSVLKTVIH